MRKVTVVRVDNVAEIVMGQAPPGNECNTEGRGEVFVKAGEFSDRYPVIREWTTKPLRRALRGDVLICVVGATAGKVNLGIDCAIGRSVAAVRPIGERVRTDYLHGFFRTQTDRLRARSQGVAQGVITAEMLQSTPLPLPSLAEQKRIATILDAADALREKRLEAKQFVRDLEFSYFRELFGDPTSNPKRWPLARLGDLASNEDGRRVPVKAADRRNRSGAYPYYGASGIIDYVDEYLFEGDRLLIGEDGANLLARSSPIAFMASGRFWVNNHAHVLASNRRAELRFLQFVIELADLKPFVSGTAQPKLNQANLDRIPVISPPLEMQRRFCAWVKKSGELLVRQDRSAESIAALVASFRHSAFRGEL